VRPSTPGQRFIPEMSVAPAAVQNPELSLAELVLDFQRGQSGAGFCGINENTVADPVKRFLRQFS